ncbi:MAG: Asp-tRNA(Asn)/Glu-tRNA(Gln) amidotransferase subunit GatB, partial [Clostridia bacterium]|nr:Asp-tRNA(Asn)/Glu-tRNA(Gln) amidotransferase subunit GatB [Clostridia bacterium]
HFEEDAGKLLHDESFSGSLVDFNRCGVPLIEIVSEPDLRSSEEAKTYLETVSSILAALNISDCKMQEGSIRCDINVSIRPRGSEKLGTRCEMKNVNSFGGTQRAIEYEIARQIKVVEAGGTIDQETRRWDDGKGMNFIMRSKEDAQDYRYFPEPDLLTIVLDDAQIEAIRATIPELPNKKLVRLMKQYGLPEFDAGLLAESPEKAQFFESCAALQTAQPKTVSNWLICDMTRILNDRGLELSQTPVTPEKLARMVELIENGTISNTAGKTVLEELFAGKTPDVAVKEKGLAQISDRSELETLVQSVLEANPKSVADYRGGKTNAAGFLVGQCMKASGGKGNPQLLRGLLVEMIEKI